MSKTSPQKLLDLVGKKYLAFTPRGNAAIKLILEILKMQKKYDKVLLQDQGGWLTYPQFVEKLKFEKIELKTDYGLVYANDLKEYKDSILLINSMPAYAFLVDMDAVMEVSKENNIFVINDVSGSIGTEEAKFGDVVFGSFGEDKPLELGEGGFIATDNEEFFKEIVLLNTHKPTDEFLDKLDEKIDLLEDRLSFFEIARYQVIDDLNLYNIIHPEEKGINVIIKYSNEMELNEILLYLKENNLEHTMCPRYIRVNDVAVSIEIKRAKQDEPYTEQEIDFEEEDDSDADKKRDINEE